METGDQLSDWVRSPLGQELLQQEEPCIQRMLEGVFGYYLLQIGLPIHFARAVAASPIRSRILVPPHACPQALGPQILAHPEALPIKTDSIDAIFLPHTLDFTEDPHQVLREADRVLIPEGRIILLGFNNLSLWGFRRWIPSQRRQMPWCGAFLSAFRVCDWLSLLGFAIEQRENLMFRPPWRRTFPRAQLPLLESLGSRFWSPFGGVYAIRAVKRVSTLTPLRPAWMKRRRFLPGGAVKPTTREAEHG